MNNPVPIEEIFDCFGGKDFGAIRGKCYGDYECGEIVSKDGQQAITGVPA